MIFVILLSFADISAEERLSTDANINIHLHLTPTLIYIYTRPIVRHTYNGIYNNNLANLTVGRRPTPVGQRPTPIGRKPTPVGRRPTPVGRRPTPVGRRPTPIGRRGQHGLPRRGSKAYPAGAAGPVGLPW